MKILSFFLFFGSFLRSWIRIRIRNLYADPDLAAQINADPCRSGSGSETLIFLINVFQQHYRFLIFLHLKVSLKLIFSRVLKYLLRSWKQSKLWEAALARKRNLGRRLYLKIPCAGAAKELDLIIIVFLPQDNKKRCTKTNDIYIFFFKGFGGTMPFFMTFMYLFFKDLVAQCHSF
jgi:hypothetical protein